MNKSSQRTDFLNSCPVSVSSPPTHFELASNSGCVLDLPHPLSKAFKEGASTILPLVATVRNNVVWGEVASAEEAATEPFNDCGDATEDVRRLIRRPNLHLMGPEEEDRDSLLVTRL